MLTSEENLAQAMQLQRGAVTTKPALSTASGPTGRPGKAALHPAVRGSRPASARRQFRRNMAAQTARVWPKIQSLAPPLPACPVDCEWDDWSQWEGCSVTCGSGFVRRSRTRKLYEKNGGHVCYGTEDDEKVSWHRSDRMNYQLVDCPPQGLQFTFFQCLNNRVRRQKGRP